MAGLRAKHIRGNAIRDSGTSMRDGFRNPFDTDRKRKALTAGAAKMARVVSAVIKAARIRNASLNTGSQWIDPSRTGR